MQELPVDLRTLWLSLSYENRLHIAEFIFGEISRSPCSFRRLIYDRLGFSPNAYCPLYHAGGMDITNSFSEYFDGYDFPGLEKGSNEEKTSS